MDRLNQIVAQASRRLFLQSFLGKWKWSLCVAFIVSAIGIAVRKLTPVEVDTNIWFAAWLGGAFAIATIVALLWATFTRRARLDAAVELDRRFELKERLSSALTLDEFEQNTPAGQALLADAVRRAERIDLREKFTYEWSRRALFPLVPAALALGLMFLDDASHNPVAAHVEQGREALIKQIKESTEPLIKQIAEQRKEADDKGLADDTKDLLKALEEKTEDIHKQAQKSELDTQKAVEDLNDISKKLDERRDQVDAVEDIKDQLSNLKQPDDGPANEAANSLKNGDFDKAAEEISKIGEQLKDKKLSDDQQKLEKQVEKISDNLKQQNEAREQAKKDLKQQSQALQNQKEMAKSSGQNSQSQQIQQQIDRTQQQLQKLEQKQQSQKQSQQLSQKLDKIAEGLKTGNQQKAQEGMDDLKKEMKQLAKSDKELESIDKAKEMATECKECVNGQKSDQPNQLAKAGNQPGKGNSPAEEGQKPGQGKSGPSTAKNGQPSPSNQFGTGQGPELYGEERPEDKSTKLQNSKVDQDVQAGASQIVDDVAGPNRKGNVQEQIKIEIEAAKSVKSDPSVRRKLPKNQQEQLKEYYKALKGDK